VVRRCFQRDTNLGGRMIMLLASCRRPSCRGQEPVEHRDEAGMLGQVAAVREQRVIQGRA